MRVPTSLTDLTVFARETSDQCLSSLKSRINQYMIWKSYRDAGSEDASRPSIYNRCGPHSDRVGSFLYSADDIRFLLKFGREVGQRWHERAEYIGDLLTEEFHGAGCDLSFADALDEALCYGACMVKTLWNEHKGLDPYVVLPSQFGVWREDLNSLDKQEAMAEVTFITTYDLDRRLRAVEHPKREEIMNLAANQMQQRTPEQMETVLHQVIIGGIRPVGTADSPAGPSQGTVNVFNTSPTPSLSPKVLEDVVQMVELWVLDDDRSDWTTIQFLPDPGIVIEPLPTGAKRNLLIPHRHPYTLVQPNGRTGYFFGRSEYSDLWRMQDIITQRLDDIEHITKLRAHPPRAFIGFTSIAEEQKEAAGAPDGLLIESSPNAKIENLAPEMPQDAYTQLQKMNEFFDELGGWTPVTLGQGVPGVRSGEHATELRRAGGARMRNRALKVERQGAEYGDLCLEIIAAKEPGAEVREENKEKAGQIGTDWMLSQMPEDRRVSVDSHSGSPAFASDNQALAFNLRKADAIDGDGLLMLTHPPNLDHLRKNLRERQKAAAQFAKDHPELAAKQAGRKR